MAPLPVDASPGCEVDPLFVHLPADWASLARTHRAFCKPGGVPDAAALLQLLLRHVEGNDSLKRTTALAAAEGGPAISAVALHKRLGRSGPWLEALVRGLGQRAQTPLPEFGRRVLLLDATVITEPGSTGTDWRLHTLLNLADLQFADVVVTDASGGERLDQFPLEPGDLILMDRGYANPRSVAYAQECGADVLIRWKAGYTGLRAHDGARLDLPARLAAVARNRARVDWTVGVETAEGVFYPGRLIAERTSQGWLLLFTTLPLTGHSARRLVAFYRARWQVELSYKRHKSLLGGGRVPKVRPDTARAWLLAKVLAHQLIHAEVAAMLRAATSLPPHPA